MSDEMDTAADNRAESPAPAEPAVEKLDTGDAPSAIKEISGDAAVDESKIAGEAAPAEPSDEAQASEPPGEPRRDDVNDEEMKDAPAEGDSQTAVTNGAPVTPASKRKSTTNGSSKKKSSGVPEHKTKKLNRKKSKADLHLNCQPGELYLARMKGHPPWPSVICDNPMLPQSLIKTRPVTTAQEDGTFKKPEYADGGKRAHERTFPIMFLHTNEFAWMPNTDLTPITADDCKNISEKGKSKNLLEAYNIAAQDYDLDHYKKMLFEHQQAVEDDMAERAEREAKKAEKAEKARRKSEAVAADDEMDVDDDEQPKPKSKKRKKSMDADEEEEKPAKTPKTTQKLKLNAPKTPTAESSKKKTPAKTKPSTKKQSAKNASAEDMADTPVVEEKQLTPAEAKEKREKEIKYYRHKLQKGFLSRDDVPSDDEVASMSSYLQKLEGYPDLEGSIIRATKIHKVLKAMIKLDSIPKDDVHNFRKRSMDLLRQWNTILAESDPAGATTKDDEKQDEKTEEKPLENGDKASEDKMETNGVAEVEPTASGALVSEEQDGATSKIGTSVEGEKEAEKPAEADKTGNKAEDAPEAEFKPQTETAEAAEVTA